VSILWFVKFYETKKKWSGSQNSDKIPPFLLRRNSKHDTGLTGEERERERERARASEEKEESSERTKKLP
jgi:hypothetical protein